MSTLHVCSHYVHNMFTHHTVPIMLTLCSHYANIMLTLCSHWHPYIYIIMFMITLCVCACPIVYKVEFLLGWGSTLQRDLAHALKTVGTGSHVKGKPAANRPAWMEECDDDVSALQENDGTNFESHGRTENDTQKKARKQRDHVYAKYNHLWDDGPSWGKLLDKHKIALCNELGRPPLSWCPALSARRVSNYINTRKSKRARMKNKAKCVSVCDCVIVCIYRVCD